VVIVGSIASERSIQKSHKPDFECLSKDIPVRMATVVHCLKPIPRKSESVKKEERSFAFPRPDSSEKLKINFL